LPPAAALKIGASSLGPALYSTFSDLLGTGCVLSPHLASFDHWINSPLRSEEPRDAMNSSLSLRPSALALREADLIRRVAARSQPGLVGNEVEVITVADLSRFWEGSSALLDSFRAPRAKRASEIDLGTRFRRSHWAQISRLFPGTLTL
jgi:hypothetical protein